MKLSHVDTFTVLNISKQQDNRKLEEIIYSSKALSVTSADRIKKEA